MEIKYLLIVCFALVTMFSGAQTQWTDDDEESLATSLELDELDFDDVCKSQVMQYEWNQVTSTDEFDVEVLEQFADSQRERAIENIGHKKSEFTSRTDEVARKLELVSTPGDIILPKEKYTKLLTFAANVSKAIASRRSACEQTLSISCDLTRGDPGQLLETWNKLAVVTSGSDDDLSVRYPEILKLASEAAEGNGSPNLASYWLMLSELEEDGYDKAKLLWEEVKPLYRKLHQFVTTSLRARYGSDVFDASVSSESDARIPAQLLGSRLGFDWTSIADLTLTKNCKDLFDQIKTSLEESKMSGKLLYQKAEKITGFLNIGKLSSSFWKESLFEDTCPAKLVDPCRVEPRVAACNQSTWTNYLDSHEITMRSIQSQLLSSTQLGYMLINGNRFSAVDTGIAGLATLIASNRHYLSQQGVLNKSKNTCLKEALLMLVALRELPKLPYYLVADLARMDAVESNRTADIGKIWRQFMYDDQMQGLSTPDSEWWGFLEDSHIASNRPYISHFYGVFLQFHLFEEMLMKDEGTTGDAEQFIHSRAEFKSLLELGRTKKWPQLLQDTFDLREITSMPLLRFFTGLDKLISPKESRTSPASVPTPVTKVVVTTSDNTNSTESRVRNVKPTVSVNSTEASTKSEDAGEGIDIVTYVLIGCGAVIAIALVVFLVNYGRRKFSKNHEYQPPTNQPA